MFNTLSNKQEAENELQNQGYTEAVDLDFDSLSYNGYTIEPGKFEIHRRYYLPDQEDEYTNYTVIGLEIPDYRVKCLLTFEGTIDQLNTTTEIKEALKSARPRRGWRGAGSGKY